MAIDEALCLVEVRGILESLSRLGQGTLLIDLGPPFFLPNIAGCLLMGTFVPLSELAKAHPPLYAGLTTGFCGSCTTFATWMVQVALLVQLPPSKRVLLPCLRLAVFVLIRHSSRHPNYLSASHFTHFPSQPVGSLQLLDGRWVDALLQSLVTLATSLLAFLAGSHLGFASQLYHWDCEWGGNLKVRRSMSAWASGQRLPSPSQSPPFPSSLSPRPNREVSMNSSQRRPHHV